MRRAASIAVAVACASTAARADDRALRYEAAFAERQLFQVRATGAELDVAPSAYRSESFDLWLPMRTTYARTPNGLSLAAARVGLETDFHWWHFHGGMGAGALLVGFRRASDASWVVAPGLALTAMGRFDVLSTSRVTVFTSLRADWGPTRRLGAGETGVWTGYSSALGVEVLVDPR